MNDWSRALSMVVPTRGTTDPTDLIALPAILLSLVWGRRFVPASR